MTTTAHEDQFGEATEKHIAMYSIEEILRRNVADLELALKQQAELAEAAEAELLAVREDNHSMMVEIDELRKELARLREQEPVGEIHFPPNNQPLEVFWYGENPNYAVRIGIYADPKPAASIVDDAIAQRIALAVYDYQNRISDEPLMHAINRILIKGSHLLSAEYLAQMQGPKPAVPAVPEQLKVLLTKCADDPCQCYCCRTKRKAARALLGEKP